MTDRNEAVRWAYTAPRRLVPVLFFGPPIPLLLPLECSISNPRLCADSVVFEEWVDGPVLLGGGKTTTAIDLRSGKYARPRSRQPVPSFRLVHNMPSRLELPGGIELSRVWVKTKPPSPDGYMGPRSQYTDLFVRPNVSNAEKVRLFRWWGTLHVKDLLYDPSRKILLLHVYGGWPKYLVCVDVARIEEFAARATDAPPSQPSE